MKPFLICRFIVDLLANKNYKDYPLTPKKVRCERAKQIYFEISPMIDI